MEPRTKFTHIINPVHKSPEHELSIAQPVTFASIKAAKSYLRDTTGDLVQIICAVYDEDLHLVPGFCDEVVLLNESFKDVTGQIEAPKLPLVREILSKASKICSSKYVIYSNIDISIMPYFYSVILAHLNSGVENLIINRRTIFPDSKSIAALPMMYSLIGQSHPGYDCFIFKADCLPKFDLGNLCLGLPGFDWVMALNLWYRGGKNLGLYDHHLTFHIGDDKKWISAEMQAWQKLNYEQIIEPINSLKKEFGERDHFLWPRPAPLKRSHLSRVMNRFGREIIKRWPGEQ